MVEQVFKRRSTIARERAEEAARARAATAAPEPQGALIPALDEDPRLGDVLRQARQTADMLLPDETPRTDLNRAFVLLKQERVKHALALVIDHLRREEA